MLYTHFELINLFDRLFLLQLLEEGRQRPLRSLIGLKNVDDLGLLVVLVALFIQGEIGQMHKRLLKVIPVRLLVFFCAESCEALISYVGGHLALVYPGYDNVYSHVEFEAADQQRIIDVPLDDHSVLQGVGYTLQVLEDLDLCAL